MSTSERMLRLLSLLQTHRYWPGPELSDRLEVSPRTLRRDVDRLRDLGYTVDAVRGAAGGYQLRAGGSLPPLLLEDEEAVAIANLYAPEHLSLATADAPRLVPLVRNAGAIFAGVEAAETFGDYLGGSSHVLPTDGAARFTGGVSTLTFMKAITVQSLTAQVAAELAGPAAALARLEGLEAHARAAEARRAA